MSATCFCGNGMRRSNVIHTASMGLSDDLYNAKQLCQNLGSGFGAQAKPMALSEDATMAASGAELATSGAA